MLRAAVRSSRRACTTHTRQEYQQQQRHTSQSLTRHVAAMPKRHSTAPPATQAMLLDRYNKQHQYNYHHSRSLHTQPLGYWTAALAASSVCIATGRSGDDNAALAAPSSNGSSNNDSDKSASDLLAELKKKLQALANESLASLQQQLPDEFQHIDKQLQDFLESGTSGQISWGFIIGVCSGYALKKVSKVGALALGALFVLMQCASYSGYIDVNYQKLERDVMELLDINKDGKFDAQDVDSVYQQVMKVLEFSLPAGSGYAVGFLVGFRAG